jgi:hypothetical protein
MLAVGIVIGFVLGGIAPRRDVVESEEQIARLERALAEDDGQRGGWRSPVPGLDRILREPERGRALPSASGEVAERATAREDDVDDNGDGEVAQADSGDAGVPREGWRERWQERAPDERLEAFQRAVSIQRVRRVQSRAALAEQAGLDQDELAELDAALGEMNTELHGHGEELLVLALGDEPPAPRDLLGITHDVTGILHRAQLRLETLVGPERMEGVDPSALEIWNFIDLAELEPAARAAIEQAP